MNRNKLHWFVYIIETKSKSLYTGISTDVQKRFADHKTGKGAKFFRMNPPKKILFIETHASKSSALKREHEIKQLTPTQKRKLLLTGS